MIEDINEIKFKSELDKLGHTIHKIAAENGFWDMRPEISRSLRQELRPAFENSLKAEKLCLIHAEVSEALEALRKGNPADSKLPHHTEETVELADVIIRILDYTSAYSIPIWDAVLEKVKFNNTRERKHGKRF